MRVWLALALEAGFSFGVPGSDAVAVVGGGGLGEFEDECAFVVEADVVEADRVFGDYFMIDTEAGDVQHLGSVEAVGFEFEGVFNMRIARAKADRSCRGFVQHETISRALDHFPRHAAQLDIAPSVHRRLRHHPSP